MGVPVEVSWRAFLIPAGLKPSTLLYSLDSLIMWTLLLPASFSFRIVGRNLSGEKVLAGINTSTTCLLDIQFLLSNQHLNLFLNFLNFLFFSKS